MSYQQTVVAFLDILGTRDNRDFAAKHRVHQAFHQSMRDCQARDREEAAYYRRLFNFSDCAYIFHGHREGQGDTQATDLLINTALFNTTMTVIRLLNEGFLVRGGIALGDAFLDDMSFFGPAVEEAYALESKQAITPRLLLSADLGARAKAFADQAHREAYGNEHPMHHLLPQRTYVPELIKQEGGAYYLNPLYILEMCGTLSAEREEFTHAGVKAAVLAAIDRQIPQHSWESPVRPKLEWMREFAQASTCSLQYPESTITVVRHQP